MKNHIKKLVRYEKIKRTIQQNEKLLMPGMLLCGVAVDFLTFKNIEIKTAFLILAVHYVILGCAIILSHIQTKKRFLQYFTLISPLAIQFSLGALLSASLIFYWYSGTLSASWPVLGLIAVLMLSNEVFRKNFRKPTVQIGSYYFVTFSILTLVLPFLFNTISVWLFIAAGIISLFIIYTYITFLSKHITSFKTNRKKSQRFVVGIFIVMNALYIFNIIPPIPLSLKEAGIYHSVTRTQNGYTLAQEHETFLDRIIPGQTIHITQGETIYAFTSIFAPTKLNTQIYHQWEFKQDGKWIEKSRPSYRISGGRENGYRGFTRTSNLIPGKWRVTIETKNGQALGRIKFKVETQPHKAETITTTR